MNAVSDDRAPLVSRLAMTPDSPPGVSTALLKIVKLAVGSLSFAFRVFFRVMVAPSAKTSSSASTSTTMTIEPSFETVICAGPSSPVRRPSSLPSVGLNLMTSPVPVDDM